MVSFCSAIENICVTRGDSPVIPVEIRDSVGAIVDITGYSFILTVDPSPEPSNNTNNLFQKTIPAIPDGSSGITQFQLTTTDTDQTPGVFFYDIQMTTTAPSIRTILSGEFEIKQDVTKT